MGQFGIIDEHTQGLKQGIEQGIQRGEDRISQLTRLLAEQNRMDDIGRAAEDKEYREKLYQEFGV